MEKRWWPEAIVAVHLAPRMVASHTTTWLILYACKTMERLGSSLQSSRPD